MSKTEEAPICRICGKPKVRGTLTRGKKVEPFWMCGTLQWDHDQIMEERRAELGQLVATSDLAVGKVAEEDIVWDDEDPDELDWEDV